MATRDIRIRTNTHLAKRATILGVVSALIVFFSGFFVMNILWNILPRISGLSGLFDYRAATIGDGLFLPLMVGGAVVFLSVQAPPNRVTRIVSLIVGGIFALFGAGTQLSWLQNANIGANWTIPRPHYFNIAGWYHAAFFTGMFFILGLLFTRIACAYKNRANSAIERVSLAIFWFGGSGFIFMISFDDLSHIPYLKLSIICLISCILFAVFFCSIAHRRKLFGNILLYCKIQLLIDLSSIISGVFSAFGIALFVMGKYNSSFIYPIIIAIFSIVFVQTKGRKLSDVLASHLMIALPSITMLMALASHTTEIGLAVFCIVTLVFSAVAISLLEFVNQGGQFDTNLMYRHIPIGIATYGIIAITTLIHSMGLPQFKEIIDLVVSVAVGFLTNLYVEQQFGDIISSEKDRYKTTKTMGVSEAEQKQSLDQLRIVQATTYYSIALIVVGAFLFVVNQLTNRATSSGATDYWAGIKWSLFSTVTLVCFLVFTSIFYIIARNKQYEERIGKTFIKGKYIVPITLVLCYISLLLFNISIRCPYYIIDNPILLVVLVFGGCSTVGVAILIARGFSSNMYKLHKSSNKNTTNKNTTNGISIIIFFGVLFTFGFSLLPSLSINAYCKVK